MTESTNQSGRSRPLRVLVVDDTEPIRKLLRRLIEVEHAEVVGEAHDGDDAISAVELLRPDLVIMDFNMPVRGGVSATAEIKRRWPEVEVLGYSSAPFPEITQQMLEAGAAGSYDKLHIEELVDAVKKRIPRSPFARTRVVIADDNDDIRLMLATRLEMTNVDIVGYAKSGREAIDQVEALEPDIIVMDLKMSEIDGIEATRTIKARWPDVKVIGYTAYSAKKLIDAGADASFHKTAPEELIQAVVEFG